MNIVQLKHFKKTGTDVIMLNVRTLISTRFKVCQ